MLIWTALMIILCFDSNFSDLAFLVSSESFAFILIRFHQTILEQRCQLKKVRICHLREFSNLISVERSNYDKEIVPTVMLKTLDKIANALKLLDGIGSYQTILLSELRSQIRSLRLRLLAFMYRKCSFSVRNSYYDSLISET